ncbi:MAG: diguanylate cyclase [Alphaproteobacteria bacterium]
MSPAATAADEEKRLAHLRGLDILDAEPAPALDRIVALAARMCAAPMAALALVDADRVWLKARFGLGVDALPRASAFCARAIESDAILRVDDAAADPRFRAAPLVAGAPAVRAYAGAPLIAGDGVRLGTLCVMHPAPAGLDAANVPLLADLAATAVDLIAQRGRVREALAERDLLQATVTEHEFSRSMIEEQAATLVELAEDREELHLSNVRQRRFIQTLLDTVPIPIFARDERYVITHANPAYAAIHGRPMNDIVGRTLDDVLGREALDAAKAEDRLMADEQTAKHTYERRLSLGETFQDRDVVIHKALIRAEDGSTLGVVGAIVDVTEAKALQARLERLAATDPLTGAANRRAFMEKAEAELARSRRHGNPLSLIMIDIDKFKSVNDVYGHHAGDAVLKTMAAVCMGAVRQPVDMFARLGGEEFVLLLPETGLDGAEALAERLRAMLEATVVDHEGRTLRFTASFGVASVEPAAGPHALDAALQAADACLYLSKKQGRNRVTAHREPRLAASA